MGNLCAVTDSEGDSNCDNIRGYVPRWLMLQIHWELPPPEMKGSPKWCPKHTHLQKADLHEKNMD